MTILRKLPIGLSGLALAFASLGNNLAFALADIDWLASSAKTLCGFIAVLILAALVARALFDREGVAKEYRSVVAWTVTPSALMAIQIMATYLKPYAAGSARVLWYGAVAIQLLWVCAFIWKYVVSFKLDNVVPSWLIVFVGIVVATATSVAFDAPLIGVALLCAGLTGYAFVMPVIAYRFRTRGLPEQLQPLMGIVLAPINLCIAGYLSLVSAGVLALHWWLLAPLLTIATASLVFYLYYCVPRMFRTFYPTFSAFTFPLVITSVAFTQLAHQVLPWLAPVATVLQMSATFVVVFVFIRYIIYVAEERARTER